MVTVRGAPLYQACDLPPLMTGSLCFDVARRKAPLGIGCSEKDATKDETKEQHGLRIVVAVGYSWVGWVGGKQAWEFVKRRKCDNKRR